MSDEEFTAPMSKPGRYNIVTVATGGAFLIDTITGRTWRVSSEQGAMTWLPIPRRD